MQQTRRELLGILGTSAAVGLSGCSSSEESEEPQMVTIEIGGSFENERMVELEVLPDTAETGLSENIVFQQSINVGPSGPEDALSEIEDAFESQRALVRVGTEGLGVMGEYTFVPDCPPGGENPDAVLHIWLHSPFDVLFRQNRCR